MHLYKQVLHHQELLTPFLRCHLLPIAAKVCNEVVARVRTGVVLDVHVERQGRIVPNSAVVFVRNRLTDFSNVYSMLIEMYI